MLRSITTLSTRNKLFFTKEIARDRCRQYSSSRSHSQWNVIPDFPASLKLLKIKLPESYISRSILEAFTDLPNQLRRKLSNETARKINQII